MTRTRFCAAVAALVVAAPVWAAEYSVKEAATPAPKELQDAVRKVLKDKSVQVLDAKGAVIYEFWFRRDVPVKATAAQIQNSLTYQEVPETTLLGAVKFDQPITDYRKQKIKAGVYTLRFAVQPMNGDHMGTAPYSEFVLLVPADKDKTPDPLADAKSLYELSEEASGKSHPAIMLLVPSGKPPATPEVTKMGTDWVLKLKEDAAADGKKAILGLGLTVIGHTTAE